MKYLKTFESFPNPGKVGFGYFKTHTSTGYANIRFKTDCILSNVKFDKTVLDIKIEAGQTLKNAYINSVDDLEQNLTISNFSLDDLGNEKSIINKTGIVLDSSIKNGTANLVYDKIELI
jgi:hypothetical protein